MSFQKPATPSCTKSLVEAAPPLASLRAGEIGKDCGARPDDADEVGAIGILHEVVPGFASVVGSVALVGSMRDVQVGDGDRAEMLFAEIGD